MRPSLIIGIGGTGMAIGHALKYFIHTLLPDNERNNFKFVFIDNDKNQFNDSRTKYLYSEGDKGEIVEITNFDAYDIYKKIKGKEEKNKPLDEKYSDLYNWYDSKVQVGSQIYETGLAAYRMIGRSCGYVNRTKIQNAISKTSNELKQIVNKAGKEIDDKSMNVFIITSNSGGTGSSLFFDISVMVDIEFNTKTTNVAKTLVLIPPNYYLGHKKSKNFKESDPEYINLQINSSAFIDECMCFLQHYSKNNSLMGKYYCAPKDIKNRIEGDTIFIPFTSAILFDNTTLKNKHIEDYKFFNAIAEVLFYTVSSSSNEEFISKISTNTFIRVDEKTGNKIVDKNQFLSIGIKVLRYPKEEFEKYFKVRYVYEVFRKLLEKNPSEKKIEDKAKEFVSEAFTNSKNNIIIKKAFSAFDEHIRTNPDTSNIRFREEYEDNPLGLFKKEGSENFQDEVEIKGDFNKHENDLEIFRRKIEEIYQDLRRTNLIVAFKDRYQARGNSSDDIREKLWEKAYDVIAELGYYGIVGVEEETYKTKGYVEIIRELLINYYTQTVKEYSQTDVIISQIKKDINDSRAKIIEKSRAMVGTKKVKTAESEINQYIKKLREYRETITQKHYLIIKQEILYHFAVGDATGVLLRGSAFDIQLASDTELTKYEKEMKLRIGTSTLLDDAYRSNLEREFDDTREDSYTIKNNYVQHLTSEFRESEKDVFTTYLPMPLVDLVDHRSEDGWKRGNELDKIFNSEMKISKNEIDKIIDGQDKEEWKLKFAQLSDSKDHKKTVKSVIEEIKERVEKYCKANYISNKESVIGERLNNSINSVIQSLNQKQMEQLKKELTDIDFPANAPNMSDLQSVGPYYNVHPQLKDFIANTFNAKKDDIIENPQLEKNKIVAVLYKRGVDYNELKFHNIHQQAYLNRNKNLFRPFLNKRWNEFTTGPWEDPELGKQAGEPRLKIKIDRKEKELTFRELIAFCVGIDLIFQKSPELIKKMFITDKKIITQDGLINRSIIHYDGEKFVYAKDVKYDTTKKLRIRQGLEKDNFVELNLSLDLNKFLNESETNRNYLQFGNSAQELSKTQIFIDSALESFCIALSNYKEDIKRALNKNIKSLSTNFRNLAVELKERKGNLKDVKIEDSDFSFADEFDENMRRLLKDFFGIK